MNDSVSEIPTNEYSSPRERLETRLQNDSFRLLWVFKREADAVFSAAELKPLEAFALDLTAHGSLHPKDLADALETSAPVVSILLRRLEQRGFVTRQLDCEDHRRTRVSLTQQGEAQLERLKASWRELQSEKLERLSEDDLNTLDRIHRTLLETL